MSQDDLVVHFITRFGTNCFRWFNTKDEIRQFLKKLHFPDLFIEDFLDWINEAFRWQNADYLLREYICCQLQSEMKRQGNLFRIGENNVQLKCRRACRIRRRELTTFRKQQEEGK